MRLFHEWIFPSVTEGKVFFNKVRGLSMTGESLSYKDRVSTSFHWIKILSLQMVIAGHFWSNEFSFLWLPTTVGLILFGFISSYYTISPRHFEKTPLQYWWYKAKSFYPLYWILSVSILVVEYIRTESLEKILHPHTLVHLMGMTGFINWLGIDNQSVLGNGLWFLTVLILFWILYPFVRTLYHSRFALYLISGIMGAVSIVVTLLFPMGHMLALTVWGFLMGGILGTHFPKQAVPLSFFMKMIAVNFGFLLGFYTFIVAVYAGEVPINSVLNLSAILLASLMVIYACLQGYLGKGQVLAENLSKWGLSLYILHTYLFFYPFEIKILNHGFSLLVCCVLAVALETGYKKIRA